MEEGDNRTHTENKQASVIGGMQESKLYAIFLKNLTRRRDTVFERLCSEVRMADEKGVVWST